MQQVEIKKTVLITGAARRIGAEISRTLHDAGMNIVLHYHSSRAEAMALCDELNDKRAYSAVIVQSALHEQDSEKKLMADTIAAFGRLDVLVNNASRFYPTVMGKVNVEQWEDLINSNLRAPFFLAQAAAAFLKETEGCIINITDIHGEKPLQDYPVYSLTKSGLLMMTQILAKELAGKIRVNAVSPGPVLWPEGAANALSDEDKKRIANKNLLERHSTPQDIAKAVLFFARDAECVTGQVLNVDGGRLLST